MKKILLVAALALAAASQAEAAPRHHQRDFAQGNWTCTIASAPTLKLFLQVKGHFARAAVRAYPYYGQTNYQTLIRTTRFGTVASFRGRTGHLSLRYVRDGVMSGAGRINTTIMLLTCARS